MTKDDHINYWVKTAENDWDTVNYLFKGKKYVYCLFFAHLTLEKLIKAHWVKDNEDNYPPKTHNLVYLLSQTNLDFNMDEIKYLEKINDFQIEGRYPDYLMKINKITNLSFTKSILDKIKTIRKCLIEKLQ